MYSLQQMIGILGVVAPMAGALYTWYATQKANARKELVDLAKRLDAAELQLQAAATSAQTLLNIDRILDDHEKRMLSMEGEFKHLPAREDVSELKLAIVELSGTVGRLEEQLKGSVGRLDEQVGSIGRTVHRIDDYLREEGKRS